MGYSEFHVPQLDGSDNAGFNCAAASLATQIRVLTGGELKPRPEQLRRYIDNAKDRAGLTGSQVAEAYRDYVVPRWDPKWGKVPPFRLKMNDDWDDFIEMLDRGFTAHTQLQYSKVPNPYRRATSSFQGGHSVLTIKRMKRDDVRGFLVSDPLKSRPLFWPEKVMKAAAFERSGDGYIDAAYIPRDMFNRPDRPDDDIVDGPDPVDDVPVPPVIVEPTVEEILRENLERVELLSSRLYEDGRMIRMELAAIAARPIPE